MSDDDRKSLNMNMDDFDDFVPKQTKARPSTTKAIEREVDKVSNFPRREAPADGQLNMKGNQEILDRFKAMCKDDRRSYVDMLGILMENFEKPLG